MKRRLISLISLGFIISILLVFALPSASAEEGNTVTLTLSVSETSDSGTDYVTATLGFASEDGISGFDLLLDYNCVVFEPVVDGSGNAIIENSCDISYSDSCVSDASECTESGYGRIHLVAAQDSNTETAGKLFSVKFKKKTGTGYSGTGTIFLVNDEDSSMEITHTNKNGSIEMLAVNTAESVTSVEAAVDGTKFKENAEKTNITQTNNKLEGDCTVDVSSNGELSFKGYITALLVCYQSRRLLGVSTVTIEITEGNKEITFSNLDFTLFGNGSGAFVKIFFLNGSTHAPVTIPLKPVVTVPIE